MAKRVRSNLLGTIVSNAQEVAPCCHSGKPLRAQGPTSAPIAAGGGTYTTTSLAEANAMLLPGMLKSLLNSALRLPPDVRLFAGKLQHFAWCGFKCVRNIFTILGTLAMSFATVMALAQVNPVFDVYARPGALVEIAPGRRLNMRCEGAGPVTVILESGLGFPSYSWRFVQPEVAKFARVCSYDRAGLGFSDSGPMPRRASAIADDLEALVDRAGLVAPFVLGGSSAGSQSVRLFAFRRSHQVQALLLVDPYVEGQYATLGAVEPSIIRENAQAVLAERNCFARLSSRQLSAHAAERASCIGSDDRAFSPRLMAIVRQQRMSAAGYESAYSESEQLETGSEEDIRREQRPLGARPITVLSAGQNFIGLGYSEETTAALNGIQAALHGQLASLSTQGRVQLVREATHVIQASEPAVVVEEIHRLIAGAAPSSESFVRIPAGQFFMGCVPADTQCEQTELPQHRLTLTRDYWMALTETTVCDFRRFTRATSYRTRAEVEGRGRFWRQDIDEWDWVPGLSWRHPFAADQSAPDNWPAVQIAWEDADAYCRWRGAGCRPKPSGSAQRAAEPMVKSTHGVLRRYRA